ncbi:MAG: alanine:cation symporter family protein [Bdellovibrionales bacterium]|nr:alanine:cation symporter family protein [Bdellovibrionales bacterium]
MEQEVSNVDYYVGLLNEFLGNLAGMVWGMPLVILLVGSGTLLTLFLGFPQIRLFGHAIRVVLGHFDDPNDPGEISHFQALCTALSATVGLGNIAGVAVAIKTGGPGAVFWMILVGLIGMSTKFTECTLALMYRHVDKEGHVHGGPMHYIERGLGKRLKPLAWFFAFACVWASFGAANMFQTNQVANILNAHFQVDHWLTGLVLAILTAVVIIGGIQRIGSVTSKLVPFMGGIYVIGSLFVILSNASEIPSVFYMIFHDAFSGTAAVGGFAGAAVSQVLIQGVRRACFSNEAGLGSAPIAHSAAATNEPVREGVVALLEPFVDTVVICTMTATVILISGQWKSDLNGVELTAAAFDSALPGFGSAFIPIAVFLFAYSTLLSWFYYGETSVLYLFGDKGKLPYKVIYCTLAFFGALWTLGPVLNFSDIMLGLMVVPNMTAIILLFPKVHKATRDYVQKLKSGAFHELR